MANPGWGPLYPTVTQREHPTWRTGHSLANRTVGMPRSPSWLLPWPPGQSGGLRFRPITLHLDYEKSLIHSALAVQMCPAIKHDLKPSSLCLRSSKWKSFSVVVFWCLHVTGRYVQTLRHTELDLYGRMVLLLVSIGDLLLKNLFGSLWLFSDPIIKILSFPMSPNAVRIASTQYLKRILSSPPVIMLQH